MNIKKLVLGLLILLGSFSLNAQQAKDVVLVVDTSSNMFSYYNEVNTWLTGPFLAENVRMGDTLHIISFSGKPRFEIVRRIVDQGDIETVSGRIWLLYPLDPNSDPGSSINYTEQYAMGIPGNRSKKVFVVSDDDNTGTIAASAAGRLKPNGIDLTFIKASKRMGASSAAASQSSVNQTAVANQTTTAKQTTAPKKPVEILPTVVETKPIAGTTDANPGTTTAATTDSSTNTSSTTDTNPSTADSTNTDTGTGPTTTVSDNNSSGTLDTTNQSTNNYNTRQSNTSDSFSLSGLPLPLIFGGLLLLLLIILIIIGVTRRLHNSPRAAVTSSAGNDDTAARNAELLNSFASRQAASALQGNSRRYQYKDPGSFLTNPPMLNLFVEEQNTAIGNRNVHTLKQGSSYSVGGGNSDFLIFLVPVPARLGLLYFDGNNCTFTPLRPKYFPDIGSTPVQECIGKTIRVLSDKNYEVFFHFERYKDPLIVLNQLLNSIQVPEPPEPWRKN